MVKGLTCYASDVGRLHFEHPLRGPALFLAPLGLQNTSPYRGTSPGFWVHSVAFGIVHASTDNIANIGTLGRYTTEDRCGAQFNGSVLHVPSYRRCILCHP